MSCSIMIHKHVRATHAVSKSVTPERDINFENNLLLFFSQHFIRSCSHVICGKPSRGEKFLCGCASGTGSSYKASGKIKCAPIHARCCC